jgi:uncharacterized repeat protein (TIGR02543 family)
MKSIMTKSIILLFVVSLLMSFAACGNKKDEPTTGVPTTAEQSTTVPSTEPQTVATPLSVEVIKAALVSAGASEWDGDYATLTEDQKQAITAYFSTLGKTVEFRDDNVYFIENSGETTLPNNETTDPSQVQTSTTKASTIGVSVKSLTLNASTVNLNIGGTKALKATISPSNAKDKSVTWRSSNDKVASVNTSGIVIAKTTGTASIVCTANGGSGISASCTVTVTTAPTGGSTGAVLSYVYNENEKFFYVEEDPWQRNFGFNRLYDDMANFAVMWYDTVRVKFNYAGKDWMIQMWKGQYGLVFIGSEIGVYTKSPNQTVEHYDCASNEDSLKMQMSLYNADKWLFTRTYATYWWATGFVPGGLTPRYNDASGLTMLARITLKDKTMKDLFVKGLQDNNFATGYSGFSTPDTYKVIGNDVYFNWKGDSPLTKITFDAAGGIGGTGPIAMKYGAPLAAPVVTKEGYTFIGWKKAGFLNSKIIEFPQTVPSAHTTYIAQWSKNETSTTLEENG